MNYNEIDTGISQIAIDMDKTCPECGEKGVTGNGVCLSCMVKIVKNERMKTTEGMKAQLRVLEIQENTRNKMRAAMGHNSDKADPEETGGISGERLMSFVKRIESLNADKEAICDDLKEVFAESKAVGFENKIIRQVVKLRKLDVEKRRENEELLSLYMSAIGME
ncbi:MAG: DUF2312 domain-containing protein [Alphaproteobacteria bacterium]